MTTPRTPDGDADLAAFGDAMRQATMVLCDIATLGARDLGWPGGDLPLRSGHTEAELRAMAERVAPVMVDFARRVR